MINQWLKTLGELIIALLVSSSACTFGRCFTSFTPCSLSSMPLVIGYVGGYAGNDVKKAFKYSLVFCGGMAITFAALGTAASILGRLVQGTGSWWYILLGILMVMMALQTWEIFDFIPQSTAFSKNPQRGYLGAVLAGILGGLFASPCATPVLVVLLAIVADKGSLLWGVFLLIMYSIGHSILLLIAGTSIGFVKKLSASQKYGRFNKIFKIIMAF